MSGEAVVVDRPRESRWDDRQMRDSAPGWHGHDGQRLRRAAHGPAAPHGYFRCLLTSLVISNMFTLALPPNTGLSAASALMVRLFFGSCSLFFLM
jgi:hypothetical protein